MAHMTDGTLRRLLDEPHAVADPERDHVVGCAECRAALAAAEHDAARAAAALGGDLSGVAAGLDVDAAWRRLSREAASAPRRAVASPPAPWRARLRSPVVAGVGAAAILAGAGAAAAGDWLPIFRTEQVAPVAVTEADLVQLPDLTAYGDVEVTGEPDLREVEDAAAAEAATGLEVPEVDELPRGVTGEPVLAVGDRLTAVFRFSADEAARTAAEQGETLPPPPPGLDGSRFRLVAGPGVAAVWSSTHDVPALLVGRAVAPAAYSSGVPFDTARDYLLSLPGLPDDLASQLQGFAADGSTLPLPVPAGEVTASTTDVGGVPGTLFTTRDGTVAGVVWVEDGFVTAVAGSLSAEEALAVARDLEQP